MGTRRKVFLPRWVGYVFVPILALAWLGLTYDAFFVPDRAERVSIPAWLAATGVLLGTAVLIWLQSSGRLPAYEIEMDDDGDENAAKGGGKGPPQS